MEERVRRRLLASHRETLAATVEVGRAVARAWPGNRASDPGAVRRPLETLLRDRGLAADLLALLDTGAAVVDESIQGSPVPAPPYFAITSRGPLCRATLSGGDRLVVRVALFRVGPEPPRYRFRDPDPDECVRIRIR